MPDTAVVALILFGGALIRSVFGFGDALFAMPLLSLVIGVSTATPIMALVSLIVAAGVLITSRRHLDTTAARWLILPASLGIPLGAFLLARLDDQALRVGLGIAVVVFGLVRLLSFPLPYLHDHRWALLFGFTGGCLGGAYNVGGPPIVLYGVLRRWPPQRFRATLQVVFLVTSMVIATAHALFGLWTEDVWRLFLLSLPSVALALLAGRWLAGRIEAERFDRSLSVALVVLGVLFLVD